MKLNIMELPMLQLYREHNGTVVMNYKISKKPYKNQQKIVDYLKSGFKFGAYPEVLYDTFNGNRIPYESIVYTDGKYRWNSELIYYVENYNLILPEQFVNIALTNSDKITEKDII